MLLNIYQQECFNNLTLKIYIYFFALDLANMPQGAFKCMHHTTPLICKRMTVWSVFMVRKTSDLRGANQYMKQTWTPHFHHVFHIWLSGNLVTTDQSESCCACEWSVVGLKSSHCEQVHMKLTWIKEAVSRSFTLIETLLQSDLKKDKEEKLTGINPGGDCKPSYSCHPLFLWFTSHCLLSCNLYL